jgi:hypothetical protein
MQFNKTIQYLIEKLKGALFKWEVRYNGKTYNTYASTKKSALSKIGVRIAREENIRREFYPKYIRKVLDNGSAKIIEEKCWKGYQQIGMKKKGKRTVPNCVKKKAKKTK